MRRFVASAASGYSLRLARSCSARVGHDPPTCVILTSGGVDSSVAAAFSFSCLQSLRDVDVLRQLQSPCPPATIVDLIQRRVPFSTAYGGKAIDKEPSVTPPIRYVAVHLNNWREEDHGSDGGGMCLKALSEYDDALQTVNRINNIHVSSPSLLNLSLLDFSPEYWEGCMVPLMQSYSRGEVLNVDVLCNSQIKFGALLKHCVKKYGENTHLVTGHYARSMPILSSDHHRESIILARPFSIRVDHNDQTHFLAKLHPTRQLPFGIFPLGHLFRSKQEVRQVADALGLRHVASKKTSTGVCFISPKTSRFSDWVLKVRNEGLPEEDCVPSVVEEPTKLLLHCSGDSGGAASSLLGSDHFVECTAMHGKRFPSAAFTEGEKVMVGRLGLKSLRKLYVVSKVLDSAKEFVHELHLCERWNDKALYKDRLVLADFTLACSADIGKLFLDEKKPIWASLRHLDRLIPCSLEGCLQVNSAENETAGGNVRLQLHEQARCPAVGQLAVLYTRTAFDAQPTPSDYFVLGSGWIVSAQSSHDHQSRCRETGE